MGRPDINGANPQRAHRLREGNHGAAGGDDVIRPAYVTASGDLFCDRCGSRYDREEEEAAEDEACYWGPDEPAPGAPLMPAGSP